MQKQLPLLAFILPEIRTKQSALLLPSLKPKLKNPSNGTGETSLPTINLHLLYLFQAEYHSVESHTCSKSVRKVQARFVATLPKPQAFPLILSGHTALFQLVILGSLMPEGGGKIRFSRVFPLTSIGFDTYIYIYINPVGA